MEKCVFPSPMWLAENLSSADAPCIRWNYLTVPSGGLYTAKEILVSEERYSSGLLQGRKCVLHAC